jgi:ribosomal protein L30/L7E
MKHLENKENNRSLYGILLIKSQINLTKKEKLFLKLKKLRRINSLKLCFLSLSEKEGLEKKYNKFIKILEQEKVLPLVSSKLKRKPSDSTMKEILVSEIANCPYQDWPFYSLVRLDCDTSNKLQKFN